MTPAPNTPVIPCGRCNLPHLTRLGNPACTAHKTRPNPDGTPIPCGRDPCEGLKVCYSHGGSAKTARAKRSKAKQEAATQKAALRIFGEPRQVDPAQGLIEEYWRCAGLVTAYERVVSGLPMDDLIWSVVERSATEKGEGSERRTVAKAVPNVWVQLFNQERDRFSKLGVEIVRLGLEARRDEYIRAQVEVFAAVLLAPELALSVEQRRVAAGLLRGLGATETRMIEG